MKLDHPILYKLAALAGSAAVRAWMDTLDYRVVFYDPDIDPASPRCRSPKIYVFWHEYILFPLVLRGHCNLAMLLSRHRDAEVLSYVAYHMGFEFVRGSTNRGGAAALRQLLDKSRQMHLAITPDGPRGPRRHMAPGSIFLASKLGIPLVAMGVGYNRPWRAKSWDRFAIPRPGSRARCILSPEMFVPPDLDRDGLDHFRLKVEQVLNRLCDEAENWAETDSRKPGQLTPQRAARPLPPARALGSVGTSAVHFVERNSFRFKRPRQWNRFHSTNDSVFMLHGGRGRWTLRIYGARIGAVAKVASGPRSDSAETPGMAKFEIEITDLAVEELKGIRAFDRRRIVEEIDRQLDVQPTHVTKNRKRLDSAVPDFEHVAPVWELRVGEFRVFYDVDESAQIVFVRAVRRKRQDQTTEDVIHERD